MKDNKNNFLPKFRIYNFLIDNPSNLPSYIKYVIENIKNGIKGYGVSINGQHIWLYQNKKTFKKYLENSKYNFIDGVPLSIIIKFFCLKKIPHIRGVDFFLEFLKSTQNDKSIKIFILGSEDSVRQKALLILNELFDNNRIVGSYSPPFGFENDSNEINKIKRIIEFSNANVLFLCLGEPKTSKIIEIFYNIKSIKFVLNIGGTLDYITGKQKHPPRWVIKLGFEWLWRYIQKPRYLNKRIKLEFQGYIKLIYDIIKKKVLKCNYESPGEFDDI